MEPANSSGQGKDAVLPPELRGWNWGAFLLNWIWGIGNGSYIALLMFVPLVNFVMPFVLGARGNEWAWRNRVWRDVEHFRSVQRLWARWSVVVILVAVPSCIALPMSIMRQSEPYQLSLQRVEQDAEVLRLLGAPLEPGLMVSGSINTSGPSGEAQLQYSVSGPKAEGTVYVAAQKRMGQWRLLRVVMETPEGRRLDVMGGDSSGEL